MVRIKICGITRSEDAIWATECGADALGFNFWPDSPRYISPEAAQGIIDRLPPFIVPVGIFVNELRLDGLEKAVAASGVQAVQLHGDEPPEFCRLVGTRWPTIRAIRVDAEFEPVQLTLYQVSAVLLDAKVATHYGGTGQLFDWKLAVRAKQFVNHLILAGGLTVDNVGEAIRIVKPYGIDVCTSVEVSPGRKDSTKLREFIREARSASA